MEATRLAHLRPEQCERIAGELSALRLLSGSLATTPATSVLAFFRQQSGNAQCVSGSFDSFGLWPHRIKKKALMGTARNKPALPANCRDFARCESTEKRMAPCLQTGLPDLPLFLEEVDVGI